MPQHVNLTVVNIYQLAEKLYAIDAPISVRKRPQTTVTFPSRHVPDEGHNEVKKAFALVVEGVKDTFEMNTPHKLTLDLAL